MTRTLRDRLVARIAYAAGALAIALAPAVVLLLIDGHPTPLPGWVFWLNPFRVIGFKPSQPDAFLAISITCVFIAYAALAWLTLRRSRHVASPVWPAGLAIVPVVQIFVIAWFALAPDRLRGDETGDEAARRKAAEAAVHGLLAGIGLIVGSVAVSAVILHVYGYTLFLGSPFVIALCVAYLANRGAPVSGARTFQVVTLAFLFGAAALVGFAFEGLICLVMASPLIAGMGLIGAFFGVELSKIGRPGRGVTLSAVAVLPALLAAEALSPPRATFETVETIDIAATAPRVWDAVVHMRAIPKPPAPPFGWGLAYPQRGEISGEGVGAVRMGVFSTGVAYERVTRWEPSARLWFIVLSDPPTMRELSPYPQVNAPHLTGMFHTRDARFGLTPLPDGGTRLSLTTQHDLALAPAVYWEPIARWAVHTNKRRVLAHFKAQAEAAR